MRNKIIKKDKSTVSVMDNHPVIEKKLWICDSCGNSQESKFYLCRSCGLPPKKKEKK